MLPPNQRKQEPLPASFVVDPLMKPWLARKEYDADGELIWLWQLTQWPVVPFAR
jgi:hypothetical protein